MPQPLIDLKNKDITANIQCSSRKKDNRKYCNSTSVIQFLSKQCTILKNEISNNVNRNIVTVLTILSYYIIAFVIKNNIQKVFTANNFQIEIKNPTHYDHWVYFILI